MEIKASAPWRLIHLRGGKKHKSYVLYGGGSASDEVVRYGLKLEEGDEIYVERSLQFTGYDRLCRDDAGCVASGKNIRVGASGVYDVHVELSIPGKPRVHVLSPDEHSAEQEAIQKQNVGKLRRKKAGETTLVVLHNALIALLVFGWLIPIFWLIIVSFTGNLHGANISKFFPDVWSVENYVKLFSQQNEINMFGRWFLNTLLVSVCSTIVATLFVLMTAFAFSRFRFRKRKGLMNISMVIGLFPGMLTMFVIYCLFQYVFKLDAPLVRLVIAYSATAGLGYLVAKGFFDTVPAAVDEAAKLDGASSARIFFQIIVPLSKPIIVYTIITAFMAPWVDFAMARIILGNDIDTEFLTVALGLQNLVSTGQLRVQWFGAFAAGSVIVAIPLTLLFLFVQKYYVGGVTGGAVKG